MHQAFLQGTNMLYLTERKSGDLVRVVINIVLNKLLKRRFNRDPGPGSYKTIAPKRQFSKKGYTNGFVSKNERYKDKGSIIEMIYNRTISWPY